METVALSWRSVDAYGSVGFELARLAPANADCTVHLARLHAGGRIARHPAVGRQLMVVVAGEGEASGADGSTVAVREGDAIEWAPDESHETVTETGMVVVIVESPEQSA